MENLRIRTYPPRFEQSITRIEVYIVTARLNLFSRIILKLMNRNRVSKYGLDFAQVTFLDSVPGKGKYFSLLRRVQTDTGTHLAPHVMGTGGFRPG